MIRARRGPTRGGRSGGSRSIRHVPGSGGGGNKSGGGLCSVVLLAILGLPAAIGFAAGHWLT